MGTRLNDEEVGKFDRRLFALRDKVVNGVRPLDETMKALQLLIDGWDVISVPKIMSPEKSSVSTEFSYVEQVRSQLDRWISLGANINFRTRSLILIQAESFTPRYHGDEPLVTGGFGYDLAEALPRLWKEAFPEAKVKTDAANVLDGKGFSYMVKAKPSDETVRLVHFAPANYPTLSAQEAYITAYGRKHRLAGVEVLEKCVVDPQWAYMYFRGESPSIQLSAIQVNPADSGTDLFVPTLVVGNGDESAGMLNVPMQEESELFASFVIREC